MNPYISMYILGKHRRTLRIILKWILEKEGIKGWMGFTNSE
jgi:hypothetical protein